MSMNFKEKIQVVAPSEISVLQTFEGQPYNQMQKLLASGRTPLHMKGGMERRVGRIGTSEDSKTLQDNYFTSASLMVKNSKGDVVVATYENNAFARQVAHSLNENSTLQNGSLVEYNGMNSDDLYDAVKTGGAHIIISAAKAKNLNNDAYSEPTLRAKIWREAFAEGDKNLDKEYGALVDKITGRDFKKNRGVWVPSYEGGCLVWFGSVGNGDSDANGYIHLNYASGVLVGVGDGVASAGGADARGNVIVAPTLEQVLSVWQNKDLSENEKVRQTNTFYKQ